LNPRPRILYYRVYMCIQLFNLATYTSNWQDDKAAIPFEFSSLILGRSFRELVCYDHPSFTFVNFRSYKHNRWMAVRRFLSGYCVNFVRSVCKYTVVARFFGNYMFCNIFYEVKLHPRHAPQALQPTSKPGRPHQ
jgi:hypothetical protein